MIHRRQPKQKNTLCKSIRNHYITNTTHAWDEGVAGSNPVIPISFKIKGFCGFYQGSFFMVFWGFGVILV